MSIKIKNNDTWKTSKVFVKSSDIWKHSPQVYVNQNGTWKSLYKYSWNTGSYSSCSKTCGGGTQTRTVTCKDSEGYNYDDSICTKFVGTKPITSQSCNTQACVDNNVINNTNTFWYNSTMNGYPYQIIYVNGEFIYGTGYSSVTDCMSKGITNYTNIGTTTHPNLTSIKYDGCTYTPVSGTEHSVTANLFIGGGKYEFNCSMDVLSLPSTGLAVKKVC